MRENGKRPSCARCKKKMQAWATTNNSNVEYTDPRPNPTNKMTFIPGGSEDGKGGAASNIPAGSEWPG